ncbi:MAG: DUF177 domain-containing protein, partial [Pedosphaera parvula]|nr:DUF177 domain-containing protein [Pedosphaera parvula]
MPLLVNLRHLEQKPAVIHGEIPVEELDLAGLDELVRVTLPLQYWLDVQLQERSILIQGRLKLRLECECVRCLKPFQHIVELPDWACYLPLEGEDQAQVVNDCVDLTPYLREDILLTFPQHPLCKPDCSELPQASPNKPRQSSGASQMDDASSAWAELDKLKFEKE